MVSRFFSCFFFSSQVDSKTIKFISLTPDNFRTRGSTSSQPYTQDRSATRKLETSHRYCLELRDSYLMQIVQMEAGMGIERRWDPTTPEYQETLGYMSVRTYHRALEELQRLVIQRLFELHRMNISSTGEHGTRLCSAE